MEALQAEQRAATKKITQQKLVSNEKTTFERASVPQCQKKPIMATFDVARKPKVVLIQEVKTTQPPVAHHEVTITAPVNTVELQATEHTIQTERVAAESIVSSNMPDFDAVALQIAEMNSADESEPGETNFDIVNDVELEPITAELGLAELDETDDRLADVLALTAALLPTPEVTESTDVTGSFVEQTRRQELKQSISDHYDALAPEETAAADMAMAALSAKVAEILEHPVDTETVELVPTQAVSVSVPQILELQTRCIELLSALKMEPSDEAVGLLIRNLLPPEVLLPSIDEMPESLARLLVPADESTPEHMVQSDTTATADATQNNYITAVIGRLACVSQQFTANRSAYALAS